MWQMGKQSEQEYEALVRLLALPSIAAVITLSFSTF